MYPVRAVKWLFILQCTMLSVSKISLWKITKKSFPITIKLLYTTLYIRKEVVLPICFFYIVNTACSFNFAILAFWIIIHYKFFQFRLFWFLACISKYSLFTVIYWIVLHSLTILTGKNYVYSIQYQNGCLAASYLFHIN